MLSKTQKTTQKLKLLLSSLKQIRLTNLPLLGRYKRRKLPLMDQAATHPSILRFMLVPRHHLGTRRPHQHPHQQFAELDSVSSGSHELLESR